MTAARTEQRPRSTSTSTAQANARRSCLAAAAEPPIRPGPSTVVVAIGDAQVDGCITLGGGITRFDWRHQGASVPIFRPCHDVGPNQFACYPLLPYSNRIGNGHFEFSGRAVEISCNRPSGAAAAARRRLARRMDRRRRGNARTSVARSQCGQAVFVSRFADLCAWGLDARRDARHRKYRRRGAAVRSRTASVPDARGRHRILGGGGCGCAATTGCRRATCPRRRRGNSASRIRCPRRC